MASRLPLVALVLTFPLLLAAPAHAWVERAVKSDAVTLDLERDGTGIVSHEILLAVRGGPLSDLYVEPVDVGAELLPEATATLAESGHAAGFPIPLTPTLDGSRVSLHVDRDRGLHTGTYQVRFGYRVDLRGSGRLRPDPGGTTVEWTGPRFADGIDSARVIFRLPRAATAPRLRALVGAEEGSNVVDDRDGVFLSTFRRAADKDELEVVRPHIAKGEMVTWRIAADPAVFGVLAASSTPALEVAGSDARPRPRVSAPPLPIWLIGLAVFSISGLFGTAVLVKARSFIEVCRGSRATPRSLVPGAPIVRGCLAAAGLAGALVAVLLEAPWLATVGLFVALASGTHLPPSIAAPLRGPGQWVPLEPDAAFDDVDVALPRSARFLDAGTLPGFVLFVSLLLGFLAGAITALRHSPFHGVAVALASSLLFPIFCTGRVAELPSLGKTRDVLEWMAGKLSRDASLEVRPIGRLPQGAAEPDEVRLSVVPARPVQGLVAIEVGLDAHDGPAGLLALPFVIVRVLEGTAAEGALPKGLLWSRGRTADERVAVLRPKVPTRALTLELLRDVSRRLRVAPEPRQTPKSAARSGGSGSVASKAGTTSSPAHAT